VPIACQHVAVPAGVTSKRRGDHGWTQTWTAVAVSVLVLVVAMPVFGGAIGRGGGAEPRDAREVRGVPLPDPVPVGTTDLGSIPVRTYSDVVIWTGRRLLTFGGSVIQHHEGNAGATYDPRTGDWTPWPKAPFDPPLAGAQGVWTGRELVVAGARCRNVTEDEADDLACAPGRPAAASFDPATAAWRTLHDPPDDGAATGGAFGTAIGWDGRRALFSTGTSLLAYSPERDAWSRLPATSGEEFCMVGHDAFAFGGSLTVLEAGRRVWKDLQPPVPAQWGTCVDEGVVLADEQLDHVWFLAAKDRRWRELPAPPRDLAVPPSIRALETAAGLPVRVSYQSFCWTGEALFVSAIAAPENTLVLDLAGETWAPSSERERSAIGYPCAGPWIDGHVFQVAAYPGDGGGELSVDRPALP
jgi:hypothetical protein